MPLILSQRKLSLYLMRYVSREICNKPLICLARQKVWELIDISSQVLRINIPLPTETYTLILYLEITDDLLCCKSGNLVESIMLSNSQEAALCSVLVRKGGKADIHFTALHMRTSDFTHHFRYI